MGLNLGDTIPEINLPATDGKVYATADLRGTNATAIIWWCNHCPYVQPNQDRVIAMQQEYAARGVRFSVVCSNNSAAYPDDSFESMRQRALSKGYNFPYLHDESQDAARMFGAARTPEVYLFDAEGILRYHGRIDDNYQDVQAARSHDLRNAIDAVLAGRLPDPAETGAVGCTIKWK